ncbi:VpaChn25_0724 family phage protein [Nitrospirillum viridazoti]|uniref:ArsR family transcriptional regulator n=1 Tax=Nitrospirillum amazonense TaxID=28077 RepID=A0A560INF8_9PROT|nr:hypothetical protein [Nitrospirillum amazonense]TWB58694.1 hypothetical protein FBZ92_109187 [Nitrospirillum amazonense]
MTEGFRDFTAESRRVFILRLLVEDGGSLNESVIFRGSEHGFSKRTTRDEIRADLDLLRERGCVTEEWFKGKLRVVSITDRGTDAAQGKIFVAGVEQSRWEDR